MESAYYTHPEWDDDHGHSEEEEQAKEWEKVICGDESETPGVHGTQATASAGDNTGIQVQSRESEFCGAGKCGNETLDDTPMPGEET